MRRAGDLFSADILCALMMASSPQSRGIVSHHVMSSWKKKEREKKSESCASIDVNNCELNTLRARVPHRCSIGSVCKRHLIQWHRCLHVCLVALFSFSFFFFLSFPFLPNWCTHTHTHDKLVQVVAVASCPLSFQKLCIKKQTNFFRVAIQLEKGKQLMTEGNTISYSRCTELDVVAAVAI